MSKQKKNEITKSNNSLQVDIRSVTCCGYESQDLAAINAVAIAATFGNNKADGPQGLKSGVILAVDTLKEMKAENPTQAMLSAQAVAAHNLAVEFMGRARSSNDIDLVERHVSAAERLMNIFGKHVALIHKLQGKGQQKVTVEHVHVYAGGQAVVGQVETGGSGGSGGKYRK